MLCNTRDRVNSGLISDEKNECLLKFYNIKNVTALVLNY